VTLSGDSIAARAPLLFNDDLVVSRVTPDEDDTQYFSNADGDELLFIHRGGGSLVSPFGRLRFGQGDYVLIPKSVAHRFELEGEAPQHWLSIEAHSEIGPVGSYRNRAGQLRMDAPYSHRDFRLPEFEGPTDCPIRQVLVKRDDALFALSYDHPVLDVVGYDGTVYPWAFPILCFQPRVASVHLPPTVHGTFEAHGALICSFVPRLLDFGEGAIPCPYPHSSIDVDEVLFYCAGDFTSRKGVGPGSITWHPRGVPHGPQPGRYEGSIGATRTDELAVMLDCTRPLNWTRSASSSADPDYEGSFR
jgi:homogentisate 1,2-dioxygenase